LRRALARSKSIVEVLSGERRAEAIGKAGDEGIDGLISEDRLGLDIVYLQAKKWDGTVGRPEIQKFVGALHGKRAKKGVFITTGAFSGDAIAYVEHIDPKIVLIDGRRLAELMIDFEVGVSTARTYHVKRIDSDYFEEG
jgi:restriction system protein